MGRLERRQGDWWEDLIVSQQEKVVALVRLGAGGGGRARFWVCFEGRVDRMH